VHLSRIDHWFKDWFDRLLRVWQMIVALVLTVGLALGLALLWWALGISAV